VCQLYFFAKKSNIYSREKLKLKEGITATDLYRPDRGGAPLQLFEEAHCCVLVKNLKLGRR
jgi:hypothetical protein